MRKVIGVILAVLVIVGGLYFCGDWRVQSDDDAKQEAAIAQGIDTVPMLIMQVQKCSKLYTAEYRVHKIVTHDDALRLKGSLLKKQFDIKLPMADRKIAIPIDAKLKAYIDFSDFSEKNIERDGKKITIVLPDPQVSMTSSKIDQKNVRQYVALTRSDFSDAELADYQQQGRKAIIESIPKMGILESAQRNAAKVLVPMLKELGYAEEDITIAFRKQYGPKDMFSILRIEE
ncbi:MAG: DUF4230 domain-containing protein [Prevotella sp.]|jgi:hypothetical protein|nr:DUF4230 domain-containing protein [Prevotella sp.]